MKKLSLTLALVATVAAAGAVEAGIVYEIEVKDHEQSPPKVAEMEVAAEGKNIKMDVLPGSSGRGGGKAIFRGDRREMVVVDDDEKSYYVLDKEAMAAVAGQVGAVMGQMEEMIKSLPKEQQEAIRRAQAQAGGGFPGQPEAKGPKSEIVATGERATQAGYPCVKYEEREGGLKIRELWVTDWSNVEGGAEVAGAFEDMADFFRELMDSIPNMGEDGGLDSNFARVFQNGFPVVTREFDEGGELEEETTLRSASRRTIDPEAFEPPAGYKRRQMFSP